MTRREKRMAKRQKAKRRIVLMFSISLSVLLLVCALAVPAMSGEKPKGQPFQAIWEAINGL